MTFATLDHIYKLLEEDEWKKEKLLECASYNRREAQKAVDDLVDYAANPSTAEVAKANKALEAAEEQYKTAYSGYGKAREALEEFLNQDFR